MSDQAKPTVSVIVPMRNEEKFIAQFLDGVTAQDYPRDRYEVLLIDGQSTDRTLQVAREYAAGHPDVCIRILDNPGKLLPHGENIGIRHATGEVIIRQDVHAGYGPTYISCCVSALQQTDAWIVGGTLETRSGTASYIAKAIAIVQCHRFGVGNSAARVSRQVAYADSVGFPCLWRWVFQKVGLYNELLPRHEDVELYARVRNAGGKLLVTPEIRPIYFSRSSVQPLLRQAYDNGKGAIAAFQICRSAVRLRHWVPGIFVLSLLVLASLSMVFWPARWLLTAELATYLACDLAASIQVGLRHGWRYVPVVAAIFALHHLAYGWGTLMGVLHAPRTARMAREYRAPTLD